MGVEWSDIMDPLVWNDGLVSPLRVPTFETRPGTNAFGDEDIAFGDANWNFGDTP